VASSHGHAGAEVPCRRGRAKLRTLTPGHTVVVRLALLSGVALFGVVAWLLRSLQPPRPAPAQAEVLTYVFWAWPPPPCAPPRCSSAGRGDGGLGRAGGLRRRRLGGHRGRGAVRRRVLASDRAPRALPGRDAPAARALRLLAPRRPWAKARAPLRRARRRRGNRGQCRRSSRRAHHHSGRPFLMGNNGHEGYGEPPEFPQHQVHLPTYEIGKHEVTRGQYRRFMEAGGYQDPSYWSAEGWAWKESDILVHAGMRGHTTVVRRPDAHLPRRSPSTGRPNRSGSATTWVTHASSRPTPSRGRGHLVEADAYCRWRVAGCPRGRVGEGRALGRADPDAPHLAVGDTWDPERCNTLRTTTQPAAATASTERAGRQLPRGRQSLRLLDMVGNAYEWVADWARSYPGQSTALRSHRPLPVRAGGCWTTARSPCVARRECGTCRRTPAARAQGTATTWGSAARGDPAAAPRASRRKGPDLRPREGAVVDPQVVDRAGEEGAPADPLVALGANADGLLRADLEDARGAPTPPSR